jgi:hypothetical protein
MLLVLRCFLRRVYLHVYMVSSVGRFDSFLQLFFVQLVIDAYRFRYLLPIYFASFHRRRRRRRRCRRRTD